MSKTIYRMFWEEKKNPDNTGEANPVSKEDTAHRICQIHNELIPKYRHYFRKQELKQHEQ